MKVITVDEKALEQLIAEKVAERVKIDPTIVELREVVHEHAVDLGELRRNLRITGEP